MSDAAGCSTVTWVIENVSIFLTLEKGLLVTPLWETQINEEVERWAIKVRHSSSNVCFALISLISFAYTTSVRYSERLFDRCEMSLISSCGKIPLKKVSDVLFAIKRNALFGDNKQSILPNDTLTVCIRIWKKASGFRIRSVLRRANVSWNIVDVDSSEVHSNRLRDEDNNLEFHMTLRGNMEELTHMLVFGNYTNVSDLKKDFVDCKLSIKDDLGRSILHELCDSGFDVISVASETVLDSPGTLSSDLLLLLREATLSDATLNTEGRSFSAHRIILAARSSVFRAMFEDEKNAEGRSGVVDIEDVDSETVDRLLAFLYGDSLEGMQWEEAAKLYYAADKYAVHLLIQKCVEILEDGLAVNNVCDALVLADRHSDQELMRCAVDFIGDHQEVVTSAEWEKLEESHSRLAAKTLRDLFVKKGK